MGLEPGVIDAAALSRRSASFSAWATSWTDMRARETTGPRPASHGLRKNSVESLFCEAAQDLKKSVCSVCRVCFRKRGANL